MKHIRIIYKKTSWTSFIGVARLLPLFLMLILMACTTTPENAEKVDTLPKIFPDYAGVTIPADIAPMNFDYRGGDYDALYLCVKGSKGGDLTASGETIDMDIDQWHELAQKNRGGELTFTLCVKKDGKWKEYKSFTMFVAMENLDEWGLTYRRIAPGYEVYGKLGIYQRCLSTFDESAIIENTQITGGCVNCHTANRTNPDQFTFHIRGPHGATLIQNGDKCELLKAQNDSIKGSMVYPYWHPDGRYCAYSTNTTRQGFHTVRDERIEVFDQASDVFVYDTSTHELLLDSLLMTKDQYETYPVFSPDGKTLYFCSSKAEPIPERYKEIRYDICKISFDPKTGKYGDRVDTIFRASALCKSAIHPRPSYDGKYIMFTMADYGCFPIWHKEADNWLLDLNTGKAEPLTSANSRDAESWHNWTTNSRWFVFTSRRDDGLYTRLYLCYIDNNGKVAKPFLLPQRHPWNYYDKLMDSYNTPDFTSRKVELDARTVGKNIMSDKRIPTAVRN